ncbi:archease [[Eubacterium] cellulosolvens]|nr:archease [Candidatus Bathyarchaeota archaeon]
MRLSDKDEQEKRFKFLEHTADAYIEAYGESLEEAYANSAIAMFQVMTETSKVEPKTEESIEVEGKDLSSLLYSWLEELIVRHEIKNKLYSKFHIEIIEAQRGSYRLKAKIYGEDFNSKKHPSKTEVKAVTFHMLEINQSRDQNRIRFVLDL